MTKIEAYIQMLYGNKICHETDDTPLHLNHERRVVLNSGQSLDVWFHGVLSPADGWIIYDKD